MASFRKPTAPVALVAALTTILAGCYTEIRTSPREPPPPAVWNPEPAPPPEPPPANAVTEPIDGDYDGYSLIIDASGHHMGRIRFSFHDETYHYEGDDLEPGTGVFSLSAGEVVLHPDDSLEATADSLPVLRGIFELHRNDQRIQLLRRDEMHGLYIELGLRRESDAPVLKEEDKI